MAKVKMFFYGTYMICTLLSTNGHVYGFDCIYWRVSDVTRT
ncbi:hypothetical protein HanIR_Chr01g0015101 [Helianthus annuus]|nr:hypothetical protein HanIR_Chr01g0015101 [Helianthus annuus]